MPSIGLRGVSKAFGSTRACDNIDLEVASGEFLTLLGDSGCGKTTLLRIVAGFAAPDTGEVFLGGEAITARPPAARGMGFVFQSYALFPTKTVAENIGFALVVAGASASARAVRVKELAEMMELGALLTRFPHELSGGQQQRVALARALAAAPKALLLDEPLSALDARIRAKLRQELKDLVRRLGLTAIYVTHDQDEALALSDRIAVMRAGRIVQLGIPETIYHHPATSFVARFVGVSNIIDGVVTSKGLQRGGDLWPLPPGEGGLAGSEARILYRPEAIALGDENGIPARVVSSAFLGGVRRLTVEAGGLSIQIDHPSTTPAPAAGTLVRLLPDARRSAWLPMDDA
ncbi:MAG: ABC transporter ATP-binding protein [Beijerinckiaceae bacterium]